MKTTIVAIPSTHPGGLEAPLGAHFGHCDLYTLVKIADGKVQEVATLPNVPHQQGGCLAPVNHLAQHGVQVLIAGGMGMRPLMGFNQVGIEVLFGNGAQTVGEAVEALLKCGTAALYHRVHLRRRRGSADGEILSRLPRGIRPPACEDTGWKPVPLAVNPVQGSALGIR